MTQIDYKTSISYEQATVKFRSTYFLETIVGLGQIGLEVGSRVICIPMKGNKVNLATFTIIEEVIQPPRPM